MTSEALAAIASAILSLLFSYVLGFQTWYDPLTATFNRLVMLTLVTVVSIAAFGTAGAGWEDQLNINIVCDLVNALGLNLNAPPRSVFFHFWEGQGDSDDFSVLKVAKTSGTPTWTDEFASACSWDSAPSSGSVYLVGMTLLA